MWDGRFVMIAPAVRLSIAALLFAGSALIPSITAAQAQPAWNTPIPAQFQDSWKAFLDMKANARPHQGAMPDWTGVWTRGRGGLNFDPAQKGPPSEGRITASLTPEADAKY